MNKIQSSQLKRIASLLSGTIVSKIIQFIYFFLSAKLLTNHQFGQYSVINAFLMIALFPALEFGSELLISKNSAQGEDSFYREMNYWKVIAIPIIGGVNLAAISYLYETTILVNLCGVLLIACRSLELGSMAFLRGKKMNFLEAKHMSFSRGLGLICLTPSLLGFTTFQVHQMFLFQSLGIIVSLFLLVFSNIERPLKQISAFQLLSNMKQGLPLAISAITWIIYFKVDVLLIKELLDVSAAGLYELAYKILEVSFIFPGVIMSIFFSDLAAVRKLSEYKTLYWKASLVLFIFGLAGIILGPLIVELIFPAFFRADQLSAVSIFNTLVFTVPFVFLGHLTTQSLVLQNRQKTFLGIMAFGAVINIVLNLLLIPRYLSIGAAYATIITEFFIFAGSLLFSLKKFGDHLQKET